MFGRRSTPRKPASRYHRLSVRQLENRLVPSGVSWTGGANTLNWGDAANWSSNTVPTSADDVTINVAVTGPINLGASAYGVRSLNDTTAALAIASGGSLSLAAVTATSTFGQSVTVSSGASLQVGAGATLVIGANVTFQDNGTVNLSGNSVDCANNGNPIRINVGNGGLLHASGSTFFNTGVNWNSQLYVAGGGHLQASNCTISNLNNVYLDNGNVLNAGDLVGDTFNVPLYLPYSEVQDLSGTGSNNLSFVDIDILAGTVPNGQTLALNAIGTNTASLRYVFPGSFTIAAGANMAVAPNVSLALNAGVTLQDNGTVTLATGDSVNCQNNGNAISMSVGNGGLFSASGAGFYNTGVNWNSQLYVAGGGHLQASNCTLSNLNNVYLDNGNVLNPGDLVGNTINVPLYLPYNEVQDLAGTGSNNVSFHDINILPGTVPNGQALTLNAIGTNTGSLRYVFPGSFTIAGGATMIVGANVSLALNAGVALQDNGTVTLTTGDSVNCQNNGNSISISVGSGGLFSASGSSFYNTGVNFNSQLYVAGGGHLQASNCTISFNNVVLDNGNILNPGDLVGNTFNVPLSLPYSEVQDLSGTGSNNVSFHDINILPGTVPSGQTLALNAIGTNTASLRYVFPGSFTIAAGASMIVGPNVSLALTPGVTLQDNGTITLGTGDSVNCQNNGNAIHLSIGSGGLLSASQDSFYNTGVNYNSQLYVAGSFQAYYCSIGMSNLYADSPSSVVMRSNAVANGFNISSSAAINIAQNDFSPFGTNGLVAFGDPNATINLANNYWGTTVTSQIAAKVLDHSKDGTRPTVLYTPYLTGLATNVPPALAPINNVTVNEGSTVTFTASATDPDGDAITYSLDPGAPTGAIINPTTGVFTYTPAAGPASYTITVRATDNGAPPLSAVQSFTITVNAVPPVATLSGPTDGFQGVRGQVRTFVVSASEPDATDQAAGFSYDLHWGDGTADTLVSGPASTSVSHIFTAAGTYTITATATDEDGVISAAASVTDTINVVEVQNGTLMVGGTPSNETFDLTPGAGDTIAVSVNGTALGTFTTTGQAQVIGDGGSGDVLNLDDQANTLADQYLITASSVGRTNAATVSYVGIGTVNVKAGTSANTINVQSTAAGTPVNITMGNGANIINVGSSTNLLDPVQGPVSVTGGTGSNTLNINDQGSQASQTYAIAATTINRSGAAAITYSKMKQLVVNASSGTDVLSIVNTASTTPVRVTGGGGLTTLIGPNVTSTWTLTGANTGTVSNVTFSNIANLQGGSGTDTLKFNAAGSVSGTINGGGGSNKLDYSIFGGAVTVNLQIGASTATGGILNITSVTGSTSIANQLIGPNTPNTWSITGPNTGKVNTFAFTNFSNLTGGIDIDVFKFSNGKFVSGVINGGGGGDWLDYSAYTTSVVVNLATGSATGVNGGVFNIQCVRAGSGGSMMTGNAQGNILVGGIGADTIAGGSGRSVLIGEKGSDTVTGGSDDDIVIGDYTTFDANNAALMSMLAEWQRTDLIYSQRVSDLKTGGGLNGTNLLIFGTTVKDDGSADLLTGGAGMDWFFKGPNDTITDLQTGEQVN